MQKKFFYRLLATLSLISPHLALALNYSEIKSLSLEATLARATEVLLGLIAGIALLFVIIGGLLYVTAAGNEEQLRKAKQTITYAIIGLIVAILAYSVIKTVTTVFG